MEGRSPALQRSGRKSWQTVKKPKKKNQRRALPSSSSSRQGMWAASLYIYGGWVAVLLIFNNYIIHVKEEEEKVKGVKRATHQLIG